MNLYLDCWFKQVDYHKATWIVLGTPNKCMLSYTCICTNFLLGLKKRQFHSGAEGPMYLKLKVFFPVLKFHAVKYNEQKMLHCQQIASMLVKIKTVSCFTIFWNAEKYILFLPNQE